MKICGRPRVAPTGWRVLHAGAAPAVEGQVAVVDHGAGLFCGGVVQLLGHMQGMEVADRAAAGADEVDMGIDVAVVALDTVDRAQADDEPLLLEQRQVAVHRSQGQIRDLGLQGCIHRLGGGVLSRVAQIIQDRIPLAEVL